MDAISTTVKLFKRILFILINFNSIFSLFMPIMRKIFISLLIKKIKFCWEILMCLTQTEAGVSYINFSLVSHNKDY